LFLRLADLAVAGGRIDAPEWRDAVGTLIGTLYNGDPAPLCDRAALVDLGSASGRPNYFLALRSAKARHRIGYFPFVHDCIPALRPQDCTAETVRNYKEWLSGAFFHANGFLVNSQATAADPTRFGGLLGHRVAPPKVIQLDAEAAPHAEGPDSAPDAALGREPYVLFVSTFEPRKNHLLAFRVWLRLIEKRGVARTPLLVCVGDRKWMVEPAMALLRAERRLRRRVRILSGIAEGDLAALYRGSLFTLYPSSYEGWGLPVTESLCHTARSR